MQLLDSIKIQINSQEKSIELYCGDLTNIPADNPVDVLVVSAFPKHYKPSHKTLIGGLYEKGLSIRDLARHPEADLRPSNISCWYSHEIVYKYPGLNFNRVLCFEPLITEHPADVVSDIFQCLIPLVSAYPQYKSVAMPIVATGRQNFQLSQMLEALMEASVKWFKLGLSIDKIMIVEFDREKALKAKDYFAVIKEKILREPPPDFPIQHFKYDYDFFISYSHSNKSDVLFFGETLKKINPNFKLFLDIEEIKTGASWQQKIFEALDNCRYVVPFLSEQYLSSRICKEEFNIGHYRHLSSNTKVLIPVYLNSANLPTYMKVIQYVDCRESDKEKIKKTCETIADMVK